MEEKQSGSWGCALSVLSVTSKLVGLEIFVTSYFFFWGWVGPIIAIFPTLFIGGLIASIPGFLLLPAVLWAVNRGNSSGGLFVVGLLAMVMLALLVFLTAILALAVLDAFT